MTYPATQPLDYAIEPEDTHAEHVEAVEREIYQCDESLLAVVKSGDPTATVEALVREAAERRIARRKQLDSEDRGERLWAQYMEAV